MGRNQIRRRKKREIKTAYESYGVDVDDFEGWDGIWGGDHEGHEEVTSQLLRSGIGHLRSCALCSLRL